VREHVGFDVTAIDAGLARPTGAPTVDIGAEPGADIRDVDPVPNAERLFEQARSFAAGLPDAEFAVAETIPGGTTTALGVLTALGERPAVSSSLPENPLPRKRRVVAEALAVSDLEPGEAAGEPVEALRRVGDPVLGVVAGLVVGATETGTPVRLAGGTQLAAAAALARHAGVDASLSLETTSFVANDESAAVHDLADDLGLTLRATDPGFGELDHPATNAYVAGEAKEGVGMGGALAMAARDGVSMATVRRTAVELVDGLLAARAAGEP
jgi:NaMN:DMB phosphoribosyltransferase